MFTYINTTSAESNINGARVHWNISAHEDVIEKKKEGDFFGKPGHIIHSAQTSACMCLRQTAFGVHYLEIINYPSTILDL